MIAKDANQRCDLAKFSENPGKFLNDLWRDGNCLGVKPVSCADDVVRFDFVSEFIKQTFEALSVFFMAGNTSKMYVRDVC